jgi:uncharacterized protein (TIGR03083 family)
MNKAELLTQIREARVQLDAVLASLTDEQIIRRPHHTGWAIKDVIAHLTFWEQSMVGNLRRLIHGEPPEVMQGELDEINDQVFASAVNHPPSVVLDEFRRSYRELLDVLNQYTDEALTTPNRYTVRGGAPLWEYVWAESGEHYQDHAADIRLILDQQNI